MSSEQKVALITGASQGIGAGLVQGFLSRGYRVAANSRSIKPDAFKPDDVLTIAGDVTEPQTAQRIVSATIERFGRIDTLVNNAGIFISKPMVDYTAADFAAVISINLAGFFFVTQLVVARMLQQQRGHIVNITAALADQPIKGVPAALAALSKGGLNSVTRSLAIEFADQGIRVNAVAPGIIKTPMHPVETRAHLDSLQPMGHMGETQDVVDAVLYLEAAPFVTGEILRIDGGQHAGRW
jgi:NAD(P)-dependent dehydrogenase (short-subunit alcohol dehydrogenase family)